MYSQAKKLKFKTKKSQLGSVPLACIFILVQKYKRKETVNTTFYA